MTRQRCVHAPPIGIELVLVYNVTANEDDVGRRAGDAFTNRRHPTFNNHAKIFITRCPVSAGADIRIIVEPLDRLLKWRELSYHNSLDALILIRVEDLAWTIRCEHINVLGVDRRRILPVALEPGSVVHCLTDINKVARHGTHLRGSLESIALRRSSAEDRPADLRAQLALVGGVVVGHEVMLADRSLDAKCAFGDVRSKRAVGAIGFAQRPMMKRAIASSTAGNSTTWMSPAGSKHAAIGT